MGAWLANTPCQIAACGSPHYFHTDIAHRSCVWFHDPQAALTTHPAKNVGAVLGLCGFAQVAWRYPRSSAACLFAFGAVSWWQMPRNVHRKSVDRS